MSYHSLDLDQPLDHSLKVFPREIQSQKQLEGRAAYIFLGLKGCKVICLLAKTAPTKNTSILVQTFLRNQFCPSSLLSFVLRPRGVGVPIFFYLTAEVREWRQEEEKKEKF